MRFSDWSSDVCSSDLAARAGFAFAPYGHLKLSAVIDGLGNIVDRLVPPEGPVHVINRRIAMWTEARARGLDRLSGKKGAGASSEAIEFFRHPALGFRTRRSDERRVGKECVSTCKFRVWPDQKKK